MDEETALIDANTRNEKIKNFLVNNKSKILTIVISIVVLLLLFFGYGEYKKMNTNSSYTGSVYADYNLIDGTGNDLIYGIYSNITNTGTGSHYGIYSDVPGGSNDYAAVFNAGNVVFNESSGNYDFRVETNNNTHALFADASVDVIRFGLLNGSLSGNGLTVGGTVVNYVADFDAGGAEGTAIGIGSIEYLLDGSSRTKINNAFVPTTHLTRDLGFSTGSSAISGGISISLVSS